MVIPHCVNDAPAFSKICDRNRAMQPKQIRLGGVTHDDAVHHNQWIKGL
jgi:hypothetical protein